MIKALLEELTNGAQDLRPTIDCYISAQAALQAAAGFFGCFDSNTGLGKIKINPNGSCFNSDMARSHWDSAPLRAIALMEYCHWLLENGEQAKCTGTVWPVVSIATYASKFSLIRYRLHMTLPWLLSTGNRRH